MAAREAEIVRLGKDVGGSRDVDCLALQHRCEGQENLILQLTEQVHPPACASAFCASRDESHLHNKVSGACA